VGDILQRLRGSNPPYSRVRWEKSPGLHVRPGLHHSKAACGLCEVYAESRKSGTWAKPNRQGAVNAVADAK
jgi:hypothetical protein